MPGQSSTLWPAGPGFQCSPHMWRGQGSTGKHLPPLQPLGRMPHTLVRTCSRLLDEKELKREGKTMYIIAHAALQSCECANLSVLLDQTKSGFSIYLDL